MLYPPLVLFLCILVCLLWGGYLLAPAERSIPAGAIQFKDLEFLSPTQASSDTHAKDYVA